MARVRAVVEAAVLGEIRLQSLYKGEEFPPLFQAAFSGTADGAGGWFDLFINEVRSKICEGTELDYAWVAQAIAIIEIISEINAQTLLASITTPRRSNATQLN